MKEVYAEIITIGDEILYGQITDTNTQWISKELDKIGIKTRRKTSVGDKHGEIVNALVEAKGRVDIILLTGGLGPTKDDITKATLCEYFKTELVLNDKALEEVTEYFKKRGKELTKINWGQANLPKNCEHITNEVGSAPGMLFKEGEKNFISMPGVPHEMKLMMSKYILPRFQEEFVLPNIHHKILRTIGIGESWLSELIEDWENNLPPHIRLAYLPGLNQVRLRLTGIGEDPQKLVQEIDRQIELVTPLIEPYLFGYDRDDLQIVLGTILREKGLSIATAESCTGGYLAHLIAAVPGSSDYYLGGTIAYSNEVKINELEVPKNMLDEFGSVSEQVVIQMAKGIKNKLNADIGISLTGILGPKGGTAEKPVGTVWIACVFGENTITQKLQLGDSRDVNIMRSAIHALNLARQTVLQ